MVFVSPAGADAETVLVRKLPHPEIIAEDAKAKMLYGEFIRRQQLRLHPTLKNIVVGDKRYLFITDKWFQELVEWTEEFFRQQVPELENRKDLPVAYPGTLSMFMSNMANIQVSRRYNVEAAVLIGLMVAENRNAWGDTAADGKPRQYIVGLSRNGYIVYDFRTRQIVSGKDFVNKDYVTDIIF